MGLAIFAGFLFWLGILSLVCVGTTAWLAQKHGEPAWHGAFWGALVAWNFVFGVFYLSEARQDEGAIAVWATLTILFALCMLTLIAVVVMLTIDNKNANKGWDDALNGWKRANELAAGRDAWWVKTIEEEFAKVNKENENV